MTPSPNPTSLRERAAALRLNGLLAHWAEAANAQWVAPLIEWEEAERARRSLERRVRRASIGAFKPLADFDWSWPSRCDRAALDELMSLQFMAEAANAILVGPNGIGKSTLARNLAHQALLHGHTVLFASAGQLLGELAGIDSDSRLNRRLRHYASFDLLAIDEVGYLSYDARYADLVFEVVTRRYELRRPALLTTNKVFGEWNQVFPNAACVVTLIDRLVHRAEIVALEGKSYRLKEAQERAQRKAKSRSPAARKAR